MQNNRWYDAYPELSDLLEKIKNCDANQRDIILIKIKNLIINSDPGIIERNVMTFPMSEKRRWYDNDPYSWLIINALKHADLKLINKLILLMKEEFKQ